MNLPDVDLDALDRRHQAGRLGDDHRRLRGAADACELDKDKRRETNDIVRQIRRHRTTSFRAR